MLSINTCPLPNHALLNTYKKNGAYTDCYTTVIPADVTHTQYVQAFYSTAIFKLERLILKWVVSKPSSDAQVALLAAGDTNTFAAWRVEGRSDNQLLMCDFQNRTRSWLMVEPITSEGGFKTRLYFGSAVVPVKKSKTGKPSLGLIFSALHGFHLLYSVALLFSAKSRLMKDI